MKRFVSAAAALAVIGCGTAWGAAVRENIQLGSANELTSYCIENHVFVVAVGQSFGQGASYVPAMVQVYEERKGKVVPMRCTEPKKQKKR